MLEGWYIPQKARYLPRWVLACRNNYVYYSRGGEEHYETRLWNMKRWIKIARAVQPDSRVVPNPFEARS